MLRSRIIPCLLVHKKGLVKTIGFRKPRYVGDPLNAVKIFNEKEVDELIVLDIDATVENRGPDFEMVRKIAVECRMPFCYGGGITTVEQAKELINLGAEKVAISSAAVRNIQFIKEVGIAVGVQSVVVVIDVKKKGLFGHYEVYTRNGKEAAGIKVKDFVRELNEVGVGEIVINAIDRDGKMNGYDFGLIDMVREQTEVPLSILGGAGSLEHIKEAVNRYKIIGAAAGSLFVFKGSYNAVLINYPDAEEKRVILMSEG